MLTIAYNLFIVSGFATSSPFSELVLKGYFISDSVEHNICNEQEL